MPYVWAYDFVFDRTREGRPLKCLTVVDEYTRECLAIEVARKQTSRDVLRTLAQLMLKHGVPKHIRSDNGPEFVAKAVRSWLSRLGVQTLFIERGSPWENGYIESFNGKLRDELLNGEIFTTVHARSQSVDRLVETAVQSRPTPQRIRLSTTRTGGHQSAHRGRILTLDVDT